MIRPCLDPVRRRHLASSRRRSISRSGHAATRQTRERVVVALLDAAPPADGLSTPLAQRLESELGLRGFSFEPPADSSGSPEVLRYAIHGQRFFDVRAAPLAQGEVAQRITDPSAPAPASRSFSRLRVS